MTDAALATPAVTANDTIRAKGILHFTIGVRDHIAAAKFYSEVLGCRHMRSTERYSFMECGGNYFVLAKSTHHVNPNNPGEETHHHAFIVDRDEFDRALAIMKARASSSSAIPTRATSRSPAATPISTMPTATASRSSIT